MKKFISLWWKWAAIIAPTLLAFLPIILGMIFEVWWSLLFLVLSFPIGLELEEFLITVHIKYDNKNNFGLFVEGINFTKIK